METDELEAIAANVRVLVREELEVQHRFGDHGTPAEWCPMCQPRTD